MEKCSSRNSPPLCPFSSFPLASSHFPLVLWPPIPVTDSRGRDSSRQSLKRCRWTGRVFSFLRSAGETLNSRAVSSPLFTSQRDCEMSGNIYGVEGYRRQCHSSVTQDKWEASSRSHPSRQSSRSHLPLALNTSTRPCFSLSLYL